MSVFFLFPFFWGLGCFIAKLFFPSSLQKNTTTTRAHLQAIAAIFSSGILFYYLLFLVIRNLPLSFYIGCVFSPFGYLGRHLFSVGRSAFLGFALLFFVYWLKIFFEPISGWDARSIWFFHAKIIYFTRGLYLDNSDWHNIANAQFSHFDYPKLNACIAALAAWLNGAWNEHIPKWSLLCLFFPPLCILLSYAEKSFIYLSFFCAILFIPGDFLWNGYMDGYLCLYTSFATLFFYYWWATKKQIPAVLTGIFLGTAAGIKTEGAVWAACTLFAFLILCWVSKVKVSTLMNRKRFYFITFLSLPTVLWVFWKTLFHLDSYLQVGSASSLAHITERLANTEASQQIFTALFFPGKLWRALLVFALTLSGLAYFRREFLQKNWQIFFFSFLQITSYIAALYIVYLMTPLALWAHLKSSIDRVTLPILLTLMLTAFFFMKQEDSNS